MRRFRSNGEIPCSAAWHRTMPVRQAPGPSGSPGADQALHATLPPHARAACAYAGVRVEPSAPSRRVPPSPLPRRSRRRDSADSSSTIIASSLRDPSSRPSSCVNVVAAARIEVRGVRSSCVRESMSAARSRSPSREASMRAVASIAVARVSAIPTCALTAVATSVDRFGGRHAIAPTARIPTINACASYPS